VWEKMLHCSFMKLGSPLRITQGPVKFCTFLGGLIVAPNLGELMSKEPQIYKPIIFYPMLESIATPKHFNAPMIPFFQI